ncbi:hypothetical protein [Leptolyngbya sp. FACHB-16]|uniref:hypothetical protein n=1 Tax=unclassified Leptolyngbya TaxID=2650499 RepID=UPI001682B38A|nr:hypothetical protein [Leptolyngbya sp. FACHB-16]MBD2156749.1 hypothetical protein [Leptolyngbya sp. FACHB-16]
MAKSTSTIGNILTARVAIQGTRTLLWHRFGIDSIPLEKQEKSGVAGNDPEEWRKTVLMTSDRQLYLLNTYIFRCIRDAAPYIKRGRTFQTAVAATLQVVEDVILLPDRYVPSRPVQIEQGQAYDDIPSVYVMVAGVKNPGTNKRNIRYRVATTAGWECNFTLLWDKTVVSRGEVESLCLTAGQLVGLGDGRSIGFGRFVLKSFEVQPTALADTS